MNENDNQNFQTTYGKIIATSWLITIVVSLVLLIISIILKEKVVYNWPLSYFFGAMVNLFAFNLLKDNIRSLTSDAKRALSSSMSSYTLRLLIYAAALFICYNNTKLNVYIVASGFLTVRVAIYIYTIINRNK